MSNHNYWIGVVSRAHVQIGVQGGFIQLNHGKRAPLQKLRAGDGLVIYSPRTDYPDGTPLQAFTALGVVTTGEIYQVEMAPDFKPYRVDVKFLECKEAPIRPLIEKLSDQEGMLNAAVFVGSMPAQEAIDNDPALIDGTVMDSFTGPARFLQMMAPLMEGRGGGTVVGIGSVAGDRGRIGNYVYGAAKAGFHTYLSGLRNRLTRAGAHVVTVKPGFVDTAMTWGIEGMFLVAPPEKVASDILRAVEKRRNVIYTPFFWRYIMLIIRSIPEPIFKKMSI